MLKLLLGLCLLSSLSFANSSLLGPEQTKKFVKYSLWYEGADFNKKAKAEKSSKIDGKEIYLAEEIAIPLERLEI